MKALSVIRKVSPGIALVLIALTAASCSTSIYPVNVNEDGIAIKGYDPVAYFDDGKPVKGSDDYSFEWSGAKWLFSSREHRDAFAEDPEKFAPQYGGY